MPFGIAVMLAVCGRASSIHAQANADGTAEPQPVAAPPPSASEPAKPEAASEPEAPEVVDDFAEPSSTSLASAQSADLKHRLQRIQAERAGTTNLWPWLVVGSGAGATLFGAVVAGAHVLSCDNACSSPSWVEVFIVAGAAVTTLGTIWLVHTDHDIAQLESKRRLLELDLDNWNRAASERQRQRAQAGPVLSLRFAL